MAGGLWWGQTPGKEISYHRKEPLVKRFPKQAMLEELVRQETRDEANILVREYMRLSYVEQVVFVRNLATKVKQGNLDLDIFKAFLKRTNSWDLLIEVAPRVVKLRGRK